MNDEKPDFKRTDDLYRPVFSGNPLDRMDAARSDSQKLDALGADPAARFIAFYQLKPLMRTGEGLDICYFDYDQIAPVIESGAPLVFLGVEDSERTNGQRPVFAVDLDGVAGAAVESAADKLIRDDIKAIDLRSVAMQFGTFEVDQGRAGILAEAKSIIDWNQRHGFCARCGAVTRSTLGGFQRRCSAVGCGTLHFPRTDPVVIMLATHGENVLLGRSPHFAEGVYSALAGFMEPGETIEEAVRRELMEEAGIKAGEVRYFRSQPWPFPSSLMIGTFARAETTGITLDQNELEDARWFTMDDIVKSLDRHAVAPIAIPNTMAIAHLLLRAWVAGEFSE